MWKCLTFHSENQCLFLSEFHLLLIQRWWDSTDDVVLFSNFNQIYTYENVCCGLSFLLVHFTFEELLILALLCAFFSVSNCMCIIVFWKLKNYKQMEYYNVDYNKTPVYAEVLTMEMNKAIFWKFKSRNVEPIILYFSQNLFYLSCKTINVYIFLNFDTIIDYFHTKITLTRTLCIETVF